MGKVIVPAFCHSPKEETGAHTDCTRVSTLYVLHELLATRITVASVFFLLSTFTLHEHLNVSLKAGR